MTTVPFGDAVALAEALVRIDSRNPSLSADANGERAVALFLASVLRDWGLDAEIMEPLPGRLSVVARGGRRGMRSLMFNGHLDTVDVAGMVHPPFDAVRRDGRLYGRGASDMKSGVAAMCAAAARAASLGLDGEILVAAVCDEEWASAGTQSLVDSGVVADAAIVCEPTQLAVMPAHKGFAWIDVEVRGRAAHGSRWELGVDAIRNAGLLLAELDAVNEALVAGPTHPLLGPASLHASTIEGGRGMSTYPDLCRLAIERRTLPGEDAGSALAEVVDACGRVRSRRADFDADATLRLSRSPSDVPPDAAVVRALVAAMERCAVPAEFGGMTAWTDASILNDAGIPAICFGPGDIGVAHADEEYVMIDEIERASEILEALATGWCGSSRRED